MNLLALIEKITDFRQPTKDLQTEITSVETFHLWDHLVARYDVIEVTTILHNFAKDPDLKLLVNEGKKILKQQVSELEKLALAYGIPMPLKPPEGANNPIHVEIITDRYIYRRIFRGIQAFLPVHMMAFNHSTSPKLRAEFRKLINQEMDLYDAFIEYGMFKEWLIEPPAYRV